MFDLFIHLSFFFSCESKRADVLLHPPTPHRKAFSICCSASSMSRRHLGTRLEVRLPVLLTFCRISTHSDALAGNSRSSFTANGHSEALPPVSSSSSSPSSSDSTKLQHRRGTNLIDQYLALLLLVFIEAGLVEALASLAADPKDDSVTAKKTSLLIAEILELGNRVLPPQHAVRLQVRSRPRALSSLAHRQPFLFPGPFPLSSFMQALPRLFALTSSFDASSSRLAASDALLAVSSHDRERRVGKLTAAFEAAAAEVGVGGTESRDRYVDPSALSSTSR
jgi:hypothetical protein